MYIMCTIICLSSAARKAKLVQSQSIIYKSNRKKRNNLTIGNICLRLSTLQQGAAARIGNLAVETNTELHDGAARRLGYDATNETHQRR